MKIKRLFDRFEVKYHFSIQRVKRIEISIPDWADDAHLRHGRKDGGKDQEYNTSDGLDKVVYYKGSTRFEIDIPECKRSVEVSCTPYKTKGVYNKNRKVVIDLYF